LSNVGYSADQVIGGEEAPRSGRVPPAAGNGRPGGDGPATQFRRRTPPARANANSAF